MTKDSGPDWITERSLRVVVAHLFWDEQRRAFDLSFRTLGP
jgi:hypothetical protein